MAKLRRVSSRAAEQPSGRLPPSNFRAYNERTLRHKINGVHVTANRPTRICPPTKQRRLTSKAVWAITKKITAAGNSGYVKGIKGDGGWSFKTEYRQDKEAQGTPPPDILGDEGIT